MRVEALVAEPAVERIYECVVGGLAEAAEVEHHLVCALLNRRASAPKRIGVAYLRC